MINIELLTEFIQTRWIHRPHIKSHRLIGKMIEVKFEDGFGEVIEIEKYYNWLSEKRQNKLNRILE